jgi:hypothetical protein
MCEGCTDTPAPEGERCFMGYDPAEGHEQEKFYVMRMLELTIYGHTVDAWTQRDYPEDWPLTLAGREAGREFACWHSNCCHDGEIGTNPVEAIQEITWEEFEEARGNGWPYLPDQPVTTYAPVSAVGYIDDDGEVVWSWDSLAGDHPAGHKAG